MKSKVLITLRGGLIETISSNDANLEITVADYDNTDVYDTADDLFQYCKSAADRILSDAVLEGQILQMAEDFENEFNK